MTKFDPTAPVTIIPPVAISQRDTSRAEQVIEEVIKLDRSMATNAFAIGDLLNEIVEGDYFHADHCQTLQEFLKKHNFELSKREVDYRVKNSRVSKKLGISRERLLKAGISKIKAIFELDPGLDVVNPDTGKTESLGAIMVALVQEAGAGKSLSDIKKIVKQLKGESEGEDSVITWLNLPTFTSRKEFIEDTIELAKAMSGDTIDPTSKMTDEISTATAIERILADWRSDPNNQIDEGEQGTFEDETEYEDTDDI